MVSARISWHFWWWLLLQLCTVASKPKDRSGHGAACPLSEEIIPAESIRIGSGKCDKDISRTNCANILLWASRFGTRSQSLQLMEAKVRFCSTTTMNPENRPLLCDKIGRAFQFIILECPSISFQLETHSNGQRRFFLAKISLNQSPNCCKLDSWLHDSRGGSCSTYWKPNTFIRTSPTFPSADFTEAALLIGLSSTCSCFDMKIHRVIQKTHHKVFCHVRISVPPFFRLLPSVIPHTISGTASLPLLPHYCIGNHDRGFEKSLIPSAQVVPVHFPISIQSYTIGQKPGLKFFGFPRGKMAVTPVLTGPFPDDIFRRYWDDWCCIQLPLLNTSDDWNSTGLWFHWKELLKSSLHGFWA